MSRATNPTERSPHSERGCGVWERWSLVGAIVSGCAGQAAAMAEATSQATRAAVSPDAATQAATAIDAFGFDFYKAASRPVATPSSRPPASSWPSRWPRPVPVGETASQMDTVLHSAAGSGDGNGINSLDQPLAGFSGTFKDANGKDQQLTLRIANAPFAQSGLQLQQPFLDTLASKYGAGLRLVDFAERPDRRLQADRRLGQRPDRGADPEAARQPRLGDTTRPGERHLPQGPMADALRQNDTKTAPFTRSDGSQVSVPTMSLDLPEGSYASGTGWQAVELPYAGGSLAMTIVVPDDLATFEAGLDAGRFSEITAALGPAAVDLTLPRFKIETKSDLSSVLAGMGMPLAFDGNRADFSGITTQEQLYISKVVHQANISVDEKGTEASAATAVVIAASVAPAQQVTLHVDRPFIFAVRDTNTGAILFLGRVVDPSGLADWRLSSALRAAPRRRRRVQSRFRRRVSVRRVAAHDVVNDTLRERPIKLTAEHQTEVDGADEQLGGDVHVRIRAQVAALDSTGDHARDLVAPRLDDGSPEPASILTLKASESPERVPWNLAATLRHNRG